MYLSFVNLTKYIVISDCWTGAFGGISNQDDVEPLFFLLRKDRILSFNPALWPAPKDHLAHASPDHPVLYMSPAILQRTARRFLEGFPGVVTYAVKANSAPEVLENLVAAGVRAFDVASPAEMDAVRRVLPTAGLHYNNPVRSMAEIGQAVRLGVRSFSIDCAQELEKLLDGGMPQCAEISVRLRLPVKGAAYDFGEKFGCDPETAVLLLRRVRALGLVPSMTFHPGTQCGDPAAWVAYIKVCATAAKTAGVKLARLNVGGGFPSHRTGDAPELGVFFETISEAVSAAFAENAPCLVCEPGRAMVAEAFSLATRVKARRDSSVFLNDGIYGGLAELPILGNTDRIEVWRDGQLISGETKPLVVYGPTCDSLDRLSQPVPLPADLREDDHVVFHGLGAYSTATVTRFNGYGALEVITTERLS